MLLLAAPWSKLAHLTPGYHKVSLADSTMRRETESGNIPRCRQVSAGEFLFSRAGDQDEDGGYSIYLL